MENVSEKMIEADETIPELPTKDVVSSYLVFVTEWHTDVLRSTESIEVRTTNVVQARLELTTIDIRFSKDPTPYKVRSSSWSATARVLSCIFFRHTLSYR